jgi:Flp pilus assembly secretin CpaC
MKKKANIIWMTVTAPSQVNLRVRIAEVDRKYIEADWRKRGRYNAGRFSFGLSHRIR